MSTDVRAIIAARVRNLGTPNERADDILAALDAHGVELVTDLPDVEDNGYLILVDGQGYDRSDPATHRRIGLQRLAVARHLETEPDPADLEAMRDLLSSTLEPGDTPARLAPRLLRAGVRPPKAGA